MSPDEQSPPDPLSDARVAQLVIENALDYAIFTLDLTGRITSWSPGAERITGYGAAEAIGMDFAVLFTTSDRSAGRHRAELERVWRDGRAEDSRWHLRKNGERFWANGVTMAMQAPDTAALIKVFRDETRHRLAEEQRVLLLNELNHRINNTLVTVQSLVEQTLRATDVDGAVREDLTARLMALSQAHRSLVEQNWAGAQLAAIVERALEPYEAGEARLKVDGPPVWVSPQQAVSLTLVLHELVTNAVKYGALSTPEGRVCVSWNLYHDEDGQRHMTFLWEERGGPPVETPSRRGFGSRLIERSLAADGGGQARMEFDPEGLRCTIAMALSSPAEAPVLDVARARRES